MLRDEAARTPVEYHQVLCPPVPEPGSTIRAKLESVWGAQWGSHDEVGVLGTCSCAAPATNSAQIQADAWDESAQALVDPGRRLVLDQPTRRPPTSISVHAHSTSGLVEALEAEGVESMHFAGDPCRPASPKGAIYTRDPLAVGSRAAS